MKSMMSAPVTVVDALQDNMQQIPVRHAHDQLVRLRKRSCASGPSSASRMWLL
jgi:hypothetical protein